MGSDETSPILCGTCRVTPRQGFERNGETWSSCPKCGHEDRVVDIQQEAFEYLADQSRRSMFPAAGESAAAVEALSPRAYRWITGD